MRLVYVTLAWCAGILLAASTQVTNCPFWIVVSLFAATAALFAWRRRERRALHILLLLLALGGLRYALVPASSLLAAYNGSGGLTVEGIIDSEPQPRNDRVRFLVAAQQVTQAGQTYATSGLVLVDTPATADFAYGDRVRVTGDMFRPPTYDNFSYADYLARTGVFSQMSYASTEIVGSGFGSSIVTALLQFKAQARTNIENALPEPYSGLLMGILLGDERNIAPEVEDAFARTGAAHVIAISGYNMVIVSGIVLESLKRLKVRPRRAAYATIVIVALYTLFVGASASVLRAALMSILLIIGENIVRRKTFLPASLAFAAFALSLWNPLTLYDVGFQLSLFATLSIVLFSDPLTRTMQRGLDRALPPSVAQPIGAFLASTLIVSLAAQILTLPLITLYFERISVVSLLVNVIIVPIQPPILILGGLATLIAFIAPVVAQALYLATLLPLAWTTGVVRAFADLPFAEAAAQLPPRLVALFFSVVIGLAMLQATQPDWLTRLGSFVRRRPTMIATSLSVAALLTLVGTLFAARPDGYLHVWLLTMGHSNAILVQTPGGAQILVDGGRFPSSLLLALGDRLPFNDRSLEVVAVTQPDEFDYGALTDVLARYPAELVLTNGQPNLAAQYANLQAAFGGATVIEAVSGYSVDFSDGSQLEVLSPETTPALEDDLDDGALVLRLRYGEMSFLLTGDASSSNQHAMLDNGIDVSANALVLPQHGAPGSLSDDFLAAVAPQMVLLQSDPANRLNHPDPDTLLKVEGIPLYRTDISGVIHLWTDGVQIWVGQGG
jgi:competence protein ComEC